MGKIKQLWNQYYEVLTYLIFGVLTTVINYIVFTILNAKGVNVSVNNCISWFISVLFAFVTNKIWVFKSKTNGIGEYLIEAIKFFGSRVSTLIFELVFMFIFVQYLHYNALLFKLLAQVFIIILNYVLSKLIVFRK